MDARIAKPTATSTRTFAQARFLRVACAAAAVTIVLAIFTSLLAGCDSEEPAGTTMATTVEGPDSLGMLVLPGLYELGDGRTQALGTLIYKDLEGGFWVIADTSAGGSNDEAPVVAVIVGWELGADPAAFEDKLVIAEGRLRTDQPSVYMAGPQLVLDAVREATDMEVVPSGQ